MTLKDIIQNSRPIISELSIRTYLSNLRKVGINDEDDIPKLTKAYDIIEQIKNLKTTMQMNVLSAVLVIVKAMDMPNEIYNKYREALFKITKTYNAELSENKKTLTQEQNWVTIAELKKVTKQLLKGGVTQNALIAALYTYQPPVRLDYYDMKIVGPKNKLEGKQNFLVVYNRSRKVFVFRDFKTANKYNEVKVPVSKQLNTVINKFLKAHPDREYLLEKKRTAQPLTRNALGKIIPQVFESTGKTVSLNILRHVYISESIDIDQIKAQQKLAKQMLHDPETQQQYAKVD